MSLAVRIKAVAGGELGSAVPRLLDGCLVFERRRVAKSTRLLSTASSTSSG